MAEERDGPCVGLVVYRVRERGESRDELSSEESVLKGPIREILRGSVRDRRIGLN